MCVFGQVWSSMAATVPGEAGARERAKPAAAAPKEHTSKTCSGVEQDQPPQ